MIVACQKLCDIPTCGALDHSVPHEHDLSCDLECDFGQTCKPVAPKEKEEGK